MLFPCSLGSCAGKDCPTTFCPRLQAHNSSNKHAPRGPHGNEEKAESFDAANETIVWSRFFESVLRRNCVVQLGSAVDRIYAIRYTVSFRSTGNSMFEVLACKTKEKSENEENDRSKNYYRSKVVSPGDEDVCEILKFRFGKTILSISLKGGEVLIKSFANAGKDRGMLW